MTKTKKDIITSVIFFVLGIFLLVQSNGIETVVTSNYEVGSGFVPAIVAKVIIFFALLLLFTSVISLVKKKDDANTKKVKTNEDFKGGMLTILLLVLYAIAFDKLGFILSTFIYLYLQIFLLSNGENRKPKLILAISAVATIAIYIVFYYVFKLQLPAGLLKF